MSAFFVTTCVFLIVVAIALAIILAASRSQPPVGKKYEDEHPTNFVNEEALLRGIHFNGNQDGITTSVEYEEAESRIELCRINHIGHYHYVAIYRRVPIHAPKPDFKNRAIKVDYAY